MKHESSWSHFLLMVLACLLPLLVIFIAFGSGRAIPGWMFMAAVLLCLLMHVFLMGREREAEPESPRPPTGGQAGHAPGELALRLAKEIPTDEFEAERWEESEGGIRIGGQMRAPAETVLSSARRAVGEMLGRETDVLLQEDERGRPSLVVLPLETQRALRAAQPRQRPMLNLGLFLATLVTTTWAGAAHQGVDFLETPGAWTSGVPYAVALMLILGFHEMGHYFMARRHGVRVSLPYFIPVPFALGTFGAFISMPALLKSRRQLFDIGVAGPLAGLVVAIPALVVGLQWSTLLPQEPASMSHLHQGVSLNSSLLLALIAKVSMGGAIAQGHVVQLHPLAFAGWLGLLLTALNLLPVGQLDGGHMAHALLGRAKAAQLGRFSLFAMVALGFLVWPGLLFWALLVYFIAGRPGIPPQDDVTLLDGTRRRVGWLSFALLAVILLPLPHVFSRLIGLHCPYL